MYAILFKSTQIIAIILCLPPFFNIYICPAPTENIRNRKTRKAAFRNLIFPSLERKYAQTRAGICRKTATDMMTSPPCRRPIKAKSVFSY